MRFSFRLAELLNYQPDPKKRPGVIKAICEYTGLDRHQVAALLRNEVKNIPLSAISRLCDYLVEHGHATADQLPGALFAIEPENFWELLARRKRLELCVGIRRTDTPDWPDGAWVVASDLVLLGEVLNGVSTLGGTSKLRRTEKRKAEASLADNGDGSGSSQIPHPEHLTQSLVWSPGTGSLEEVIDRAKSVYNAYSESAGDKSLVCLGSTKSNPVVELVVASTFGCQPFQTQDDVAKPEDRNCPFYLRFRDKDPHPVSCFGGVKLGGTHNSSAPGIYYEKADGSWDAVTCDKPSKDAAFVFYSHRESQGWLEMAIFGFSGRATRLLSKTFATRAEEFWPPVYTGYGVQIGAFIIEYSLPAEGDVLLDLLRTDLVANATITPLDAEVFHRRLKPASAKGSDDSKE